MRSTPGFAALPSILIFALAGCSSGGSTQDELASDPGNPDAVETTARVADDAYTYFEIAADARKCASPMCGGWFVSRLNRATTQCHDGRYAASCYTPVLDWSQAKLRCPRGRHRAAWPAGRPTAWPATSRAPACSTTPRTGRRGTASSRD
jgi:hypothetical protein